jgi:hypothetical protein
MLTNLNFLNKGEVWPPDSESERLSMYSANRRLFEATTSMYMPRT